MFLRCAFFFVALAGALFTSAQCEYTEVVITSTTGNWGQEMGWELYHLSSDTTLLSTFAGAGDFTPEGQTFCLEDGCYTLMATDSWGDGWNGGEITSDVALDGFDAPFSMENGFFGFLNFSVGDATCNFLIPGCADPEALNYMQGATVDAGTCTYSEGFSYSDNGVSINREFIYYAPAGMEPGAPLVFVLHGYGGDGLGMYTFSGFRELADEEGFGVVFPQGALDNGGTPHWNANFDFSNVNDHAFLSQLAGYLQTTHGHEADCTYSCGYSNGGYMSYSLACDNAETFRGIGSVGGLMGGNDWNNCAPSQPVPVIHLHGTADNTVAYEGSPFDAGNWGGTPGVEAMWRPGQDGTTARKSPRPRSPISILRMAAPWTSSHTPVETMATRPAFTG